jgi:hypothetical protein
MSLQLIADIVETFKTAGSRASPGHMSPMLAVLQLSYGMPAPYGMPVSSSGVAEHPIVATASRRPALRRRPPRPAAAVAALVVTIASGILSPAPATAHVALHTAGIADAFRPR